MLGMSTEMQHVVSAALLRDFHPIHLEDGLTVDEKVHRDKDLLCTEAKQLRLEIIQTLFVPLNHGLETPPFELNILGAHVVSLVALFEIVQRFFISEEHLPEKSYSTFEH